LVTKEVIDLWPKCRLINLSSRPPYKTYSVIEVFCGEYDRKGSALISQGRFQEAIDYCNEGLKKCPDSAYYARQKGIALYHLKKEKEALECFASVIEKFHRYAKTYPPTAEDLLDITFRTIWQDASILLEMGLKEEAERIIEEFFNSLQQLEQFCYANNKHFGQNLISPSVGEYAAYVHAMQGDTENALAYVQKIIDYWQAYINYFGEPCNVKRDELIQGLKERFDRESVFEDLRKDERLWRIVDGLKVAYNK